MAMHGLAVHAHPQHFQLLKSIIVLYVGPDQILPLTSALGAIVGVLLMFWHRLLGWLRKAWQFTVTKFRSVLKRGA